MANDDSLMSQDEIERLFSQTKDPAAAAKTPPAAPAAPAPAASKDDQPLAQDDIEKLLSETGRSAGARRRCCVRRCCARRVPARQDGRAAVARAGHRHAGHRIPVGASGEGPGIGELRPAGRDPFRRLLLSARRVLSRCSLDGNRHARPDPRRRTRSEDRTGPHRTCIWKTY